MIPYQAQEFYYRFMVEENRFLRSTTQSFTAYACLLDRSIGALSPFITPLLEETNIARQEAVYDLTYNRTEQVLTFHPRPLTFVSSVDTTIDAIVVMDNGTDPTGTTAQREFPCTANNSDTVNFTGPVGSQLLFRPGHVFLTENDDPAVVIASSPGTVQLNTSVTTTFLVSGGRYILGTYQQDSPIEVKAMVPIQVRLGLVRLQYLQ